MQAYLQHGEQQNCCYGVKFWLCFWALAAQTSDNDQHWWSPRRWSGFTLETRQPSQIWLCLKAVWRKSAGLEQMCPNPTLEQGLGGGGHQAGFSVFPGRKQLSPRQVGTSCLPARLENLFETWPSGFQTLGFREWGRCCLGVWSTFYPTEGSKVGR